MKNLFKKNQIIITALAVMIAIAGYLNYSGTKFGDNAAQTTAEDVDTKKETEESGETGNTDTAYIDIESLDQDIDTAELEDISAEDAASQDTAAEGEVTDTPGEAVLTSLSGGAGFAAEAKLSREQVRAKNKETLLEVINNVNISEAQKQTAIDNMNEMTEIAEREAAAELLLESKGFQNSVVSITDEAADVVVSKAEISDTDRAQIEDIVKRKTNIAGENIVITPMAGE